MDDARAHTKDVLMTQLVPLASVFREPIVPPVGLIDIQNALWGSHVGF